MTAHVPVPAFTSAQALAIVNDTPFPGEPDWFCSCGERLVNELCPKET